MVTVDRVGGQEINKSAEFFGLTGDPMPTGDIPNGSIYVCIDDTSQTYFYDKENNQWRLI